MDLIAWLEDLAAAYRIEPSEMTTRRYLKSLEPWHLNPENKHLFEKLFEQKEQIESAFGKPLEWQRLDDRRACRVRYLITRYGLKDKEHWADLQEILISEMVNFYNAMQPELTRLK